MCLQQMDFGCATFVGGIVLGGIDGEGLFIFFSQSLREFMWGFSHSHRKVKVFLLFNMVPFVILWFVIYKSLLHSWLTSMKYSLQVKIQRCVIWFKKPHCRVGFCP